MVKYLFAYMNPDIKLRVMRETDEFVWDGAHWLDARDLGKPMWLQIEVEADSPEEARRIAEERIPR